MNSPAASADVSQQPYDLLIIGGGAAGMLAALGARAQEAQMAGAGAVPARVVILEKMAKAGRKISASGGGRCNFSNTLSAHQFVDRFGRGGKFLGAALKAYPNQELIDMLARHGVTGNVEQGYRLYTTSGRGEDVTNAVLDELAAARVPLLTGRPVQSVAWRDGLFEVTMGRDAADRPPESVVAGGATPPAGAVQGVPQERLFAKTLIIAVGGASYPKLGSTGDGYAWARQFGHTVTPLQAALVGVHVEELALCKDLQGLRMDSCEARLIRGGGATVPSAATSKPAAREPGDLLFAHFGVTGPALLDLSLSVVSELARAAGREKLYLSLDLAPEISTEKLSARLDEELKQLAGADRRRAFETRLPKRLRQVLWREADPVAKAADAAATAAAAAEAAMTTQQEALAVLARIRSGNQGDGEAEELTGANISAQPGTRSAGANHFSQAGQSGQAEYPASRTPAAVRKAFVGLLKDWRFTITGTRELEVGEVTDGGVELREVDKQTMMSKMQPGLFFCGEILDLTGRCGGFNLQAAWSTGFLAGQQAILFARGGEPSK